MQDDGGGGSAPAPPAEEEEKEAEEEAMHDVLMDAHMMELVLSALGGLAPR